MSLRSNPATTTEEAAGVRLPRWLVNHDIARVVYGTVIVFVVAMTLEIRPPPPLEALWQILLAIVAVALAELYAELIAESIKERRRLQVADLVQISLRVAMVVLPAMVPVVFIVVALFGLLPTGLALFLAQITALIQLTGYGYLAGRLRGASHVRSIFNGLLGTSIGLLLIMFKYLASH